MTASTTATPTTTTTTATTTTGVTLTGADSTGPAATSDATTDGGTFVPRPPDIPGTGSDCDASQNPSPDCPRGQKCTIEGAVSDTHCVDVVDDPQGMYEPCKILMGDMWSGFDDCGPGLVCWDVDPDTGIGRCIGFCDINFECEDPAASCITCQECVFGLCTPSCNPLLQDCPAEHACVPSPQGDQFLCTPDASMDGGQVFDPCEFVNACDPGLFCADSSFAAECDPMTAGCCLPFCDTTLPNDCPGAGQECAPWFENGEPPPGLENVGACALPK